MVKKILMLLIPVVAFLGGAAAGDFLRPAADAAPAHDAPAAADHDGGADAKDSAKDGGHGAAAEKPAADHGAAPTGGHAPAKAKPAGGHGAAPAKSGGHGAKGGDVDPGATTFFAFPQQFFVPVMRNGRLDSTMVLALSLEMPGSAAESVYAQEIRLRDLLLRQLLITANTGGFDGNFTAEPRQRALRDDLLKAVQSSAPDISAVLIGDIARQEAQ